MTYEIVATEDRGETAKLISLVAGEPYRKKHDRIVKRLASGTIQRQQLGKIDAKVLQSIGSGCTYKLVYTYEPTSTTAAKLVLLNLCVRDRSHRYQIVSAAGKTDVPCS